MHLTRLPVACLAGATLALTTGSAEAHHPMGYATPSTMLEGLLSGLGHPVIGLDHFAFIVSAGLIAGVAGLGAGLPVVFVFASLIGVLAHAQSVNLPAAELVIAASVVGIGATLAAARADLGRIAWAGLFAAVGLFHGYAYGEAVVGAEMTPFWAYLLGLLAVQTAIAVGAALIAARLAWTPTSLAPRLAGTAALVIGVVAIVRQVLPG